MAAVSTGNAQPAVPAQFVYTPQSVPSTSSMIVLGRDPQNYNLTALQNANNAGVIILIYINWTCLNSSGKYHGPLFQGASVAPGAISNATGPGALIDTAAQNRIKTALQSIYNDFSWFNRGGFFCDDAGADNLAFYANMTTAQRTTMYQQQLAAFGS